MKIGHRVSELTDVELKFSKQLGADHIIGYMPENYPYWDFLDLVKARKFVESYGLSLSAIGSPPQKIMRGILLRTDDRDDQIDCFCRMIRNMGRVGIPILCYSFSITATWGRWREGLAGGGRGGAGIVSFDYDLVRDAPLTEAGEVSTDEMWSRLTYFLERVVPVAEEEDVRLACHPDDPPVPKLRGIGRVLSSVDGMKRLIETVPSPYNGLTFCQGTVAEMGADVIEAIRYFGERKKIFVVHFRNVRVQKHDPLRYDEVFIDEGDVDMFKAMRAYIEVEYDGLLVPDHAPVVVGDSQWGRHRGIAFSLGYIKALREIAERMQCGDF